MADDKPTVTSSEESNNTTAAQTAGEAGPRTVGVDEIKAPDVTDEPTADGDASEPIAEDATTAGPHATTEANGPDGEQAEVDVTVADKSESPQVGKDATPSSNKGSKKKAGVPEHKTKKLNRKKSTAQLNLTVKPGDHLWARLKGYPSWPSVCVDESMLSQEMLASRPVSTMRPDGTYREDYLDGGKNVKDRTYPIMFLGTNEFYYMPNTQLSRLETAECAGAQDKKLTKQLKAAYEVAAEKHDLEYFKDLLKQHEEELREAEAEQAQAEAEKAEKAAKKAAEKENKEKKAKRKSKPGDDTEMDLDEDDKATKPSKKRKKDADSEGDGPKPKKTPKVKLGATKATGESSAKKTTKPKKVVSKPDSDENGDGEPLTEKQKLANRERNILYLRHRLQKGFLSREVAPKEAEMSVMDGHFTSLEAFVDLEPQIVRSTKIHKVLKAIVKLATIPKEEDFQFKKRAADLLNAWNNSLSQDVDIPQSAVSESAPREDLHVNGEAKAENYSTAEGEAEEATKEPSGAPFEGNEPGNGSTDEANVTTAADAIDEKPVESAASNATEAKEEVKAEAGEVA